MPRLDTRRASCRATITTRCHTTLLAGEKKEGPTLSAWVPPVGINKEPRGHSTRSLTECQALAKFQLLASSSLDAKHPAGVSRQPENSGQHRGRYIDICIYIYCSIREDDRKMLRSKSMCNIWPKTSKKKSATNNGTDRDRSLWWFERSDHVPETKRQVLVDVSPSCCQVNIPRLTPPPPPAPPPSFPLPVATSTVQMLRVAIRSNMSDGGVITDGDDKESCSHLKVSKG